MRARHVTSTAIATVAYHPLVGEHKAAAPGKGLLVVRFRRGAKRLYLVPQSYAGPFAAAKVCGRSVGRLFNRIVRGRCESVSMEGEN